MMDVHRPRFELAAAPEGLADDVVDLFWLERLAERAWVHCLECKKVDEASIQALDEIEITLLTDDEIARVHEEFLNDATPTDVITFCHGEILISLDTAQRQALVHGQSIAAETGLYLVHGLLHLMGWDDHDEVEAARMAELQASILNSCIAKLPLPTLNKLQILQNCQHVLPTANSEVDQNQENRQKEERGS